MHEIVGVTLYKFWATYTCVTHKVYVNVTVLLTIDRYSYYFVCMYVYYVSMYTMYRIYTAWIYVHKQKYNTSIEYTMYMHIINT